MSSDASKLHVFLLGHFEKKENKLCGENVNIDNPKFLRHQIFQNCSSCPLAFFSFQGQRWRFHEFGDQHDFDPLSQSYDYDH